MVHIANYHMEFWQDDFVQHPLLSAPSNQAIVDGVVVLKHQLWISVSLLIADVVVL